MVKLSRNQFRLVRGEYLGTTDDRADRWYIEDTTGDVVDRCGPGYQTKHEAEQALREMIDAHNRQYI